MVFWDSGNVAAVKRERVLTAHLQQRDGETLEVRENVQECCLSEQGDFAFPAHWAQSTRLGRAGRTACCCGCTWARGCSYNEWQIKLRNRLNLFFPCMPHQFSREPNAVSTLHHQKLRLNVSP